MCLYNFVVVVWKTDKLPFTVKSPSIVRSPFIETSSNKLVLPVTFNVPPSVVASDTFNVEFNVVAFETFNIELIVVAPLIYKSFAIVILPVSVIFIRSVSSAEFILPAGAV